MHHLVLSTKMVFLERRTPAPFLVFKWAPRLTLHHSLQQDGSSRNCSYLPRRCARRPRRHAVHTFLGHGGRHDGNTRVRSIPTWLLGSTCQRLCAPALMLTAYALMPIGTMRPMRTGIRRCSLVPRGQCETSFTILIGGHASKAETPCSYTKICDPLWQCSPQRVDKKALGYQGYKGYKGYTGGFSYMGRSFRLALRPHRVGLSVRL